MNGRASGANDVARTYDGLDRLRHQDAFIYIYIIFLYKKYACNERASGTICFCPSKTSSSNSPPECENFGLVCVQWEGKWHIRYVRPSKSSSSNSPPNSFPVSLSCPQFSLSLSSCFFPVENFGYTRSCRLSLDPTEPIRSDPNRTEPNRSDFRVFLSCLGGFGCARDLPCVL